jgi:creatinine amidohydrolase/Fe(II)-dependent formamide hydrolase-like protein
MELKLMRPAEIRDAVARNLPLILPLGCIECHGDHLPVGCDTIIVEEVARRLGGRMDCVVAPTVDYGPTGYDVSGPGEGTIDVPPEDLLPYARSVLRGLLRLGFRRIRVVVFHQGADGPLATTFHLAGRRLVEELMRQELGEGWWGKGRPEVPERYLDIVQVRTVVHPDAEPAAGSDHAGAIETSCMLSACANAVDLSLLGPESPWYTRMPGNLASDATRERGERMFEAMAAAWERELGGA